MPVIDSEPFVSKPAALKFGMNMNEDGVIAASGETVAGTKKYTIKGVRSEVYVESARVIINSFVSLVGGEYDELDVTKSITEVIE